VRLAAPVLQVNAWAGEQAMLMLATKTAAAERLFTVTR